MYPDATLAGLFEETPAPWRTAVEADKKPVGDVLDIVRPFERDSVEREPWTIRLSTGFNTIVWTCLPAAVALENAGYAITVATKQDMALDLMRRQTMVSPTFIECAVCTRHDRCANHDQHGDGCHCLYRGDFYRAHFPDGSDKVLCTRHLDQAHSPASTFKFVIE